MEREDALPNGLGAHGAGGAGNTGRQQANGKVGGGAASKKRKPGEYDYDCTLIFGCEVVVRG